MNNLMNFLGLVIVGVASVCTIALMLTGLWEVIKYLIKELKETRGRKNEDSSNGTQSTKIKR